MRPVPANRHPFRLLRWFSAAGFFLVAAFAIGNALMIASYLTKHMLEREGQVTSDFVQNILTTDGSWEYLLKPEDSELKARFLDSVKHFVNTRDILRTNVYVPGGRIVWSSDPTLVGRKFEENGDLEAALKGELEVEYGRITSETRSKPEHVGLHLPLQSEYFIETYIPVRRGGIGPVVGVVEIYKAPIALTAAIQAGYRQVLFAALIGALVLYLTLFWIVRRADRTLSAQHDRLIENETIAAAGELTSSIAHNIRNPLASIRSSAELSIDLRGEDNEHTARDIIRAVDRIESWIRELLRFTRTEPQPAGPVDVGTVLQRAFGDQGDEIRRRRLTLVIENEAPGARISGDGTVLAQALHSVIGNAIEASIDGGRLVGQLARRGDGWIELRIVDTGHGIAREDLASVFKPFFSTKQSGLGLGLALVRRTVERMGGRVGIQSAPGLGTTVTLAFPET